MAEYGKWTVAKLKVELRQRGAVTSGRKLDLIERLESYDRNKNFENVLVEPLQQLSAVSWPSSGFRQITTQTRSEIPPLTNDSIHEYFVVRTACDCQQTGDIQALRKGKLLVESKRVEACSQLLTGDGVYFSGIVRAAMKKKVSYNVRLKVNQSTGDIVNSDCECPAGKGPHGTCKHVAAMLGMLEIFTHSGELLCCKSCTDKLQTFHHPQRHHDGSPVKMRAINERKRKADTALQDEDPRPLKFQHWAGYTSFVANFVTSYCLKSGKDLAFRYLLPKADLQTAMREHDYTLLPFAEYWIDQANFVTPTDVSQIEQNTRNQSLCHKWFAERSWRVTASRFGDVLKATVRRNMTKLCQSMVYPMSLHCRSVVHGRRHEKAALEKFTSSTGHVVTPCGLFICQPYPFLAASPDGLVGNRDIVEAKCPLRGYGKSVVASKLFPFLQINKATQRLHLKRNSKYYFQVQGQLGVTAREACYFIVYTGVDLFVERIEFDKEYWSLCMVPRLQLFYEKHLRPFIAANM